MATKKKMLQAAAGQAGGAGLNVEEVFSTYLYESDGTTQTITNNIDISGEGGLVWIKRRNGNSSNNRLHDTERGMTSGTGGSPYLWTNATTGSQGGSYPGSVVANSTGFDITSTGINDLSDNGGTYASWTFRKAPKFFDVVTWTGDGTGARTISHNLGATVGALFMKATNADMQWFSYHNGLTNQQFLELNATTAAVSSVNAWNNTTPTSTEFSVGSYGNVSGRTYVAYLFAHNDGDGEFGPDGDQDIIKCGSYTGNGSSDGPEIDLGFEPQWLIIKRADGTGSWRMVDSMRGIVTDGDDRNLVANENLAEDDTLFQNVSPVVDLQATGFKITTTRGDWNASGGSYIYMAIRRGTKVPESGTEVFAVDLGGQSGLYSGFPVDFFMRRDRNGGGNYVSTRITGNGSLNTTATDAEGVGSPDFDDMLGVEKNYNVPSSQVAPMWKRAPGFFDAVAYTGNGVAGRTVSHNLGVAPEMMWVKKRSGPDWWGVYHKDLSSGNVLALNLDYAAYSSSNLFTTTSPTDSVFSVGSDGQTNLSGSTYIAYLFASLDGISKVGSYTGNGDTGQTIDCGFTSGARFVLIKETSSANDWYVYDSERGITSSADPYLKLNTTDAEATVYDGISPASSGFHITQVQFTVAINRNGAEYIFYAIA